MNGLINWLQGVGQYCWNAPAYFGALIAVVALWSIIWKGMALWRASQRQSKGWFVILLIVNTLGILEILYLYVFSRKSSSSQQQF